MDSSHASVPPVIITTHARRTSAVFLKFGGICLLILLLHVPLFMTRGVLHERMDFQRQATEEIAGVWGRQQLISGPVLAVPYGYKTQVTRPRVVDGRVMQVEETELASATAYFFPESLGVSGEVLPEMRSRGIFDAVVYSTRLELSGKFQPDFTAAGIVADRIYWEKASIYFGVSDLRGVRSVGSVAIDGVVTSPFEPTGAGEGLFALEAKMKRIEADAPLEFRMDVSLQGSERIEFVAVGKATTVSLQSPWRDPSFVGNYLPVTRAVSAEGFAARWEIAHFTRGFAQTWSDRFTSAPDMQLKMSRAGFGVRFAQPLSGYGVVERAQKYGVLFFVLVFTVFFLFEGMSAVRIHFLQYALVGAALCLFFLGFLALSEFLSTGLAYAMSAAACTVMIALYAWSFLKTGRRTLVIAGGLGATYGYLYFVLKSQDYALIAGTCALFGALALVMFCTRRINWDNPDAKAALNG